MKKCLVALAVFIFSLGCLLSCGLEDFPYLDYVPDADVFMDTITRVTVRLPSDSAEGYGSRSDGGYFDNFLIFYRIYISGINPVALIESEQQRRDINPTLNTDWVYIYPNTDKTSTTTNTSNLETFFYGRSYFQLKLVGASIENVLSRGSLGRTMEIFFSQISGEQPTLSIDGGTPYILQRANSAPTLDFHPLPQVEEEERYFPFLNHEDMYSSANATRDINADVADRSSQTNPPSRYTYASMYIAATGRTNDVPPSNVYSQPTHLGVFMLAEFF